MIVRMSMGPGLIDFVFVPVVLVVGMPMLVPDRGMLMFVRVVLAKEKCGGADHHESGYGESQRQRLSQEKEGSNRSEKGGCLKPRGRSGRADIPQRINEEDETHPVTECAEKETAQNKGRGRQSIPDRVCDEEGYQPCDEALDLGD